MDHLVDRIAEIEQLLAVRGRAHAHFRQGLRITA
jgi:hypothetical protein